MHFKPRGVGGLSTTVQASGAEASILEGSVDASSKYSPATFRRLSRFVDRRL